MSGGGERMTAAASERPGVNGAELLTQREAAAMLHVSVSYLRESSCPKLLLPGHGPRGRALVRYLRDDLMEWALARRT